MTEQFTTNHEQMRQWIEAHNGFPATVAGTPFDEDGRPSTVEVAFDPHHPELRRISWPEFFEWVEYHNLALRYDNEAPEGLAMFEFVDRERAQSELDPEADELDSGDEEMLRENTIPDAE